MAWWKKAGKVAIDTGAAGWLAGAIRRRGAGPAGSGEVTAPAGHRAPAEGLEAPAAAPSRLAVLSIPGRLTSQGRAMLADSVRRSLDGFGNIRLIALEEGIGIRFYDVRAGEITAGGAGVVLDLPAWKLEALEALETAREAIGVENGDPAGWSAMARDEARLKIRAAAAKLIGIHPA